MKKDRPGTVVSLLCREEVPFESQMTMSGKWA